MASHAPTPSPTPHTSCTLVGGLFSDGVQCTLFIISISSLVYKRSIEVPKRSFKVWAMDTLKQGISSNMIHVWNLVASILMASNGVIMNHFRTLHGTETVALKEDNFDECAFYFCSFFIDTTFGCVVTYWLLKGTMKLGDEGYVWPSWKTPGECRERAQRAKLSQLRSERSEGAVSISRAQRKDERSGMPSAGGRGWGGGVVPPSTTKVFHTS